MPRLVHVLSPIGSLTAILCATGATLFATPSAFAQAVPTGSAAPTAEGPAPTPPPATPGAITDGSPDAPAAAPAVEPAGPAPSPVAPTTPPTLAVAPAPDPASSRLVLRAFAGAGFAGYEDRATSDNHLFAEGAAALSGGYVALQKPGGSLAVSGELLLGHTFESSSAARAAGNLFAGGVVLSTNLQRLEIGLGGYLVSRSAEARELHLTEGHWSGGIGAFLSTDWPVSPRWSLGLAVKVLMLPTRSGVEADGQRHVRFADGLGILGLSAAYR